MGKLFKGNTKTEILEFNEFVAKTEIFDVLLVGVSIQSISLTGESRKG